MSDTTGQQIYIELHIKEPANMSLCLRMISSLTMALAAFLVYILRSSYCRIAVVYYTSSPNEREFVEYVVHMRRWDRRRSDAPASKAAFF